MMKRETILKLLWMDDERLTHKSKFMGKLAIWTAVGLALLCIAGSIIINHSIAEFRPVLNEAVVNVQKNASISHDNQDLSFCISILSEIPDLILKLGMYVMCVGIATALMLFFQGLYFIRYSQIIKNISPNQRVDLTRPKAQR